MGSCHTVEEAPSTVGYGEHSSWNLLSFGGFDTINLRPFCETKLVSFQVQSQDNDNVTGISKKGFLLKKRGGLES